MADESSRGTELQVAWRVLHAMRYPTTARQLAERTGLGIRRAYRWIAAGQKEGMVTKSGATQPYTFQIVKEEGNEHC